MATKKKIVKKPAPKKPVKKPAKATPVNVFKVLSAALKRANVPYESWEIRYNTNAAGEDVPMNPPGVNLVVNSCDYSASVEFLFDANGRLLSAVVEHEWLEVLDVLGATTQDVETPDEMI